MIQHTHFSHCKCRRLPTTQCQASCLSALPCSCQALGPASHSLVGGVRAIAPLCDLLKVFKFAANDSRGGAGREHGVQESRHMEQNMEGKVVTFVRMFLCPHSAYKAYSVGVFEFACSTEGILLLSKRFSTFKLCPAHIVFRCMCRQHSEGCGWWPQCCGMGGPGSGNTEARCDGCCCVGSAGGLL